MAMAVAIKPPFSQSPNIFSFSQRQILLAMEERRVRSAGNGSREETAENVAADLLANDDFLLQVMARLPKASLAIAGTVNRRWRALSRGQQLKRLRRWRMIRPLDSRLHGPNFETVGVGSRVLLLGGNTGRYSARLSNAVHFYDTMSCIWSYAAPMHEARANFACGAFDDGTVIVAGGTTDSVEIFNIDQNEYNIPS